MVNTNQKQTAASHPLDCACGVLDGGRAELANRLGVTVAAIGNWKVRGVPSEHCPLIEEITGIRCEELRPDVRWDVVRRNPDPAQHAAQPVAQGG